MDLRIVLIFLAIFDQVRSSHGFCSYSTFIENNGFSETGSFGVWDPEGYRRNETCTLEIRRPNMMYMSLMIDYEKFDFQEYSTCADFIQLPTGTRMCKEPQNCQIFTSYNQEVSCLEKINEHCDVFSVSADTWPMRFVFHSAANSTIHRIHRGFEISYQLLQSCNGTGIDEEKWNHYGHKTNKVPISVPVAVLIALAILISALMSFRWWERRYRTSDVREETRPLTATSNNVHSSYGGGIMSDDSENEAETVYTVADESSRIYNESPKLPKRELRRQDNVNDEENLTIDRSGMASKRNTIYAHLIH
uniref:uncharacterized protein LOC120333829 isoform X1 n=1 Tax=Styela clava TaxID=7725 RepID=UPI001939E94A|nr:uncharacterized protein LOC120333829 isoform X1 [Styela clava]